MKRLVNFKNLFNSRNKVARRKVRRSSLGNAEGLENRVLLTAQVDLVGAELQIEGTDNNDVIEVRYADEAQTLVQAVVSDANGNVLAEGTFAANQIDDIHIDALAGDDFLRNNTAIDSDQHGRNGEDTLIGGTGYDDLSGGWGNDADFNGNEATIDKDDGLVVVTGTSATDIVSVVYKDSDEILVTIEDASGNVLEQEDYYINDVDKIIIHGLEGNDTLYNITAIETEIRGGNGNDIVVGGSLGDLLEGEFGNDSLYGNAGNDTIVGADGADRLYGNDGNDLLDGGDGNDRLYGHNNNDTLLGGDGLDSLNGGRSNDLLEGGNDADYLQGGSGSDTINAGAGNDTVFGSYTNTPNSYAGNDVINGGSGNDTIDGGRGHDLIDGGSGNDYIVGGRGHDTLNGGSGNDTVFGDLSDPNSIYAGNDLIHGNDGIDYLYGGRGADTIFGDAGLWDVLYGNAGNDYLNGGAGSDYIYGGNDNDTLIGGSGRDYLYGQSGDDRLDGSNDGENDFLFGGTGADTFIDYYRWVNVNGFWRIQYEENINDFVSGEDTKLNYYSRIR